MLHKTWVAIRFRAKNHSPQTTRNFALVCSVVRTDGQVVGRSVYGHVIAKFSRMSSLAHFLTHGAPLLAPPLKMLVSYTVNKYTKYVAYITVDGLTLWLCLCYWFAHQVAASHKTILPCTP